MSTDICLMILMQQIMMKTPVPLQTTQCKQHLLTRSATSFLYSAHAADVNEISLAISCPIQQFNTRLSYKYSKNYATTNEIIQLVKYFLRKSKWGHGCRAWFTALFCKMSMSHIMWTICINMSTVYSHSTRYCIGMEKSQVFCLY